MVTVAAESGGVTTLSGTPRARCAIRRFRRLACSWLLFVAMCMSSGAPGCIVAPPTEHQESQQTPPMLFTVQAVPPITAIVTIPEYGDPAVQAFAVPVQSEDAGERLVGALIASYGEQNETRASNFRLLDPATFADGQREMRVTWEYQRYLPGCYQLSLVVTHESSFDWENLRPFPQADDVAIATWWVSLGADEATLSTCPSTPLWKP